MMPRNLLKASSKTEDSAPGPKPLKVKEEGSNVYNTVASVCDCGFGHAVRAEAVVMSSKKSNIIVINDFKGALAAAGLRRHEKKNCLFRLRGLVCKNNIHMYFSLYR